MNKEILITNLNKLHTTQLGVERIKRNANLDIQDVVYWCKQKILNANNIVKRGKNWYINIDNYEITVNSYSYTIITVHRK